jgi:hypothetical protein
MNAKEKIHLNKVARLGCYCCRVDGDGEVPAMIHHIREGKGMGQRASHFETIPLCEGHHQGNFDTSKLAFHRSPKKWRERYGRESEIVAGINAVIGRLDESDPKWYL